MDAYPIVLPPGMHFSPEDDPYGPYVALSRQQWSDLAEAVPWELDAETLTRLRGIGDPTDEHARVVTRVATVVAAREVIGVARDRGRVTGNEIGEVVVNQTAFGIHRESPGRTVRR